MQRFPPPNFTLKVHPLDRLAAFNPTPAVLKISSMDRLVAFSPPPALLTITLLGRFAAAQRRSRAAGPRLAEHPGAESPSHCFAGPRLSQDPAAELPRLVCSGLRPVQDTAVEQLAAPSLGSALPKPQPLNRPASVSVGPRHIQGLTVYSLCVALVGYVYTFKPVAETSSISEKTAVVDGAPADLACNPPFVFPSSTSGVSISTTCRVSSSLVSARTCHSSVAAAGTPVPLRITG